MLYWIFDLDLTLYQLPMGVDFNYEYLSHDHQLIYLLKSLPSYKIMFTNGTLDHAKKSINKINLYNIFKNIVARDTINTIKPRNEAYLRCMEMSNIKFNDKCVFFDDLPENLIESKNVGWITVLINKNNYIHEDIDFWFPNIYVALNYFLTRIR